MSPVTVFLGAAVVALAVGNGVLEFLKARKRQKAAGVSSIYEAINASKPINAGPGKALQGNAASGNSAFGFGRGQTPQNAPYSNYVTALSAQFSSAPLEKKIELAHWRLQALESKVRAMQGLYDDATRSKLDKLEGFRATATAEIIALKEIVEALQKKRQKGNGGGNGSGNIGHGTSRQHAVLSQAIPTDELRRIIYRSQN